MSLVSLLSLILLNYYVLEKTDRQADSQIDVYCMTDLMWILFNKSIYW